MYLKMQLQKNAAVLSADGQRIGSLNRVMVHPDTLVLTDIVVRPGTMVNQEDRVVPVKLVTKSTLDEVLVNIKAEDLETFPPYKEGDIAVKSAEPPFTEEFVVGIDHNIPKETVAIKVGASVVSADGKDVGTVERIVTDAADEQSTHLLISQGRIKKRMKLIPMDWVRNVDEETVYLLVYKTSVNDLADALVPE